MHRGHAAFPRGWSVEESGDAAPTAVHRLLPVLVMAGLLSCDTQSAPRASDQLIGVEWQLRSLVVSGDRQEGMAGAEAVLRFGQDGTYSGKTCNYFGGDVAVSGSRLRFEPGHSTSMLCVGPLDEIENQMGRMLGGEAMWSLADGVLRIEGADVAAEFVERDPPYPTRDLVVLATDQGEPGGAQFQFGYQEGEDGSVFLVWEGRNRSGEAWGSGGMMAEAGGPEIMSFGLGDRIFVLGYAPRATARTEYQQASQEPVPVELFPLPQGLLAFGGFVGHIEGQVVALDAGGREIGRSRPVPA